MIAMNDAANRIKQTLLEQSHIELDSRLSELKRAWAWAEAIANQLQLDEETRYAIHLCIEEALANTVLHGYGDEPGHSIVLRASVNQRELTVCIEDRAVPFVPPLEDDDEATAPVSLEDAVPGGNGIRLMRQFADAVAYEPFASGNRLTLTFCLGPSDVA